MESDADSYLTKAHESPMSAESDFHSERYSSCANRCYYACYQAAVAALLSDGIRPSGKWAHKFVHAQFSGQLVHRRKRYAPEFRRTLIDALALRRIADYNVELVTQAKVRPVIPQTRAFVRAVAERLGT